MRYQGEIEITRQWCMCMCVFLLERRYFNSVFKWVKYFFFKLGRSIDRTEKLHFDKRHDQRFFRVYSQRTFFKCFFSKNSIFNWKKSNVPYWINFKKIKKIFLLFKIIPLGLIGFLCFDLSLCLGRIIGLIIILYRSYSLLV